MANDALDQCLAKLIEAGFKEQFVRLGANLKAKFLDQISLRQARRAGRDIMEQERGDTKKFTKLVKSHHSSRSSPTMLESSPNTLGKAPVPNFTHEAALDVVEASATAGI